MAKIAVLVLLSLWGGLWGGAQAVGLDIAGITTDRSVGREVEVLEDPDGALTIDDLLAEAGLPWTASQAEVPNFAFSGSTYWLRLSLRNDGGRHVHRMLEAGTPLQDYLDVYLVRDGEVIDAYLTGDRRPFASRPIPHQTFVFPLSMPAHDRLDVYMRLASHDGLHEALPLILGNEADFHARAHREILAYGFYYGAILALIVYNLLIFLSTRERVFAWYVLYLAAFVLWNYTFRGFSFQYLWPDAPTLNNQLVAISSVLIFLTLALFSTSYLNTRTRAPRLHWTIVGLTALMLVPLAASLFNVYAWSFALIIPLGLAVLPTILLAAAVVYRGGYRPARYFLLAWVALIAGAMLYYLRVMGLLPASFVTEYGLNIGSALEFILLAFALADRINLLKSEKLQAQQDALAAQRTLNAGLEGKVRERTGELERLNRQLSQAAITDDLTGLYNRRYFNEVFVREYNRSRREGNAFVFCILDVDHFKHYNDQYGHKQGDVALVHVAEAIRSCLNRGSDYVFRLGGEEFGVLLVTDGCASARSLMEDIRARIANLQMVHPTNSGGLVTASLGVACITEHEASDPDAVYALADSALYAAKARGRNAVVMYHGREEAEAEQSA